MVKYKKKEMNKKKLSPKERIIKHLIENKEPQSILAASVAIVTDYKNTYNIVNELQPEIISKEKIGNTSLIKLNLVPNQKIYSVEEKRTLEFLEKNKQIQLVAKDIQSMNYPFFIVLVFGSFVKNTNTKKSDIDICIICDDAKKKEKLISTLKLLPFPLEMHEFTTKEFESMLNKKEQNLGKEIVKNNIILYGIENYYHLIAKWMKKE